MKHVGIICEFNPLHTGHARLLGAVRDAEAVICLMSGPFVQRGEAAILPPRVRAAMAIEAGADLVLELPYPFAAASARYFATAGVGALASLGVDTLAFGSETGDVGELSALAAHAPENLSDMGAASQSTGDARAYFDALGGEVASNDILGVEYLRALGKYAADVQPFLLKREGANYAETVLREGAFPSATALRRAIFEGRDVSGFVPTAALDLMREGLDRYGIADTARLGAPLLAALRHPDAVTLFADAAECGGGLLGRLIRVAGQATDYDTLLSLAATKRYTNARIRRALLFLLSGVRRADLTAAPAYLRLLAMNGRGRDFLTKTKKSREIPVVTKQAEITALGERAARAATLEAAAAGLWSLCAQKPTVRADWRDLPPNLKINT